jgi:hypothetical protein
VVGDSQAQGLGGLQVDHEVELTTLLHRQVRRLGALKDLVYVAGGAPTPMSRPAAAPKAAPTPAPPTAPVGTSPSAVASPRSRALLGLATMPTRCGSNPAARKSSKAAGM